jgi:hypothetical protein
MAWEQVETIGCTILTGYLSGFYIFEQSGNRGISLDSSKNHCQINKL